MTGRAHCRTSPGGGPVSAAVSVEESGERRRITVLLTVPGAARSI